MISKDPSKTNSGQVKCSFDELAEKLLLKVPTKIPAKCSLGHVECSLDKPDKFFYNSINLVAAQSFLVRFLEIWKPSSLFQIHKNCRFRCRLFLYVVLQTASILNRLNQQTQLYHTIKFIFMQHFFIVLWDRFEKREKPVYLAMIVNL